jgi:pentose-5-phosphate-3-epimerase
MCAASPSLTRMHEIIPAILPRDLDDLVGHLEEVRGVARLVQIDVVDGRFAPTRTWPYEDRASFEDILSEEQWMPLW